MPDRRREVVAALFHQPHFDDARFHPNFVHSKAAGDLRAMIGRLREMHGPVEAVVWEGDDLLVRLAAAEVTVSVALDEGDRIRSLLVQPAVVTAGTMEDHVRAITALPGATSVLVVCNSEPVYAHSADMALAVGSAFKVGVLAAVARAVSRGELAWDQIAVLAESWRSLPSGVLQAWPVGVSLTVQSLACLMISLSDNTATDALIALVGREAVEAVLPAGPLLTTREAFILKATGNEADRRAWLQGDSEDRRTLLQTLPARLPPAVYQLEGDLAPQIEWFVTARTLFALLRETADLPPFRINPGPVAPSRWSQIAYKAGGEPKVHNVSLRLISKRGAEHGIVATYNGEELDRERLLVPVRAIARKLQEL